MLTLSLLRHAKSSWSDASLEDIERPLNERGEKVALRMGAFMERRGLAPDLVLCSPAMRTRQTLELVLPQLKLAPAVDYEDKLYLASPAILLRCIQQVAASVSHTMLVGHNPGMHALALELTASGDEKDMRALAEKLPTGGLVVLLFDGHGWTGVKPGAGRLDLFAVPKRLP